MHFLDVKSKLSCVYCGLTGRGVCIEFDHFDPLGKINEQNTKGKPVSFWTGQGTSRYGKNFYQEILRCIALCSNCHSEKTKHEAVWEDAYRNDRIRAGGYAVGGVNGNGKRRETPTTWEITRAFWESPFKGKKVDREIHKNNLKIVYDETFQFFMACGKEAWDTDGINYLSWKWKMVPSRSGMRGDMEYITPSGHKARGKSGKRDKRIANELLTFDCAVRMGNEYRIR
jgi:hypothetical protein